MTYSCYGTLEIVSTITIITAVNMRQVNHYKIPSHLKHVATLPCDIFKHLNAGIYKAAYSISIIFNHFYTAHVHLSVPMRFTQSVNKITTIGGLIFHRPSTPCCTWCCCPILSSHHDTVQFQ